MKKHIIQSFALWAFLALANIMTAQPALEVGLSTNANWARQKFSSGYTNEYIQYVNPGGNYKNDGKVGFGISALVGAKFGERVELFLEPSFQFMRTGFASAQLTEEYVKTSPTTEEAKQGYRSWRQRMTALQVPIMLRVRVFGERIGMNAALGVSLNKALGGKHESSFLTEDGKTINGSEVYNTGPADEYPRSGDPLNFGKSAFDQFNGFTTSIILAPGFFYALDDEGLIKLTADWRWNIGLTDLYTKERKDYLATQAVDIQGTRTLTAGELKIGVVMSLDRR